MGLLALGLQVGTVGLPPSCMEEAGLLQAGCDGSSAGPGSEHHGGLCDPEHGWGWVCWGGQRGCGDSVG